jgi:hypothetical protein
VEERGEASRGREVVGAGARGHVARRGAARGQLGLRHMAGEGGRAGVERNRERRAGGRRWGPICNSPKIQGLQCKARLTFEP